MPMNGGVLSLACTEAWGERCPQRCRNYGLRIHQAALPSTAPRLLVYDEIEDDLYSILPFFSLSVRLVTTLLFSSHFRLGCSYGKVRSRRCAATATAVKYIGREGATGTAPLHSPPGGGREKSLAHTYTGRGETFNVTAFRGRLGTSQVALLKYVPT